MFISTYQKYCLFLLVLKDLILRLMNIRLLIFLGIVLLSFTILSCKGNANNTPQLIVVYEDEEDDLDEFDYFNLEEYGIQASIFLPGPASNVGATTPFVDYQKGGYKWDIFIGDRFQLRIEDWGKDDPIALHKEDLSYQTHMYNFNFIVDEPDLLFYEATLKPKSYDNQVENVGTDHISYHCLGNHRINGFSYLFRTEDLGASKEIANYVLKSINSVKELDLVN